MVKIYSIDTGYFKLDGGAMFGVVPKVIWNKLNPADDNNLCTWAMRCMLVDTGAHKVLIDTGMGNKQSEKFFSYYEPSGEATLFTSLAEKGYKQEDITDVILTHLHFDHCGYATIYDEKKELVPAFPNAKYWSCEEHWNEALKPNPREKASFLKENFQPLLSWKMLEFANNGDFIIPEIQVKFVYGHTKAMMIPIIDTGHRKIYYMADLLPSSWHLGMPYVMGYDLHPLITMEEKAKFLNEVLDQDAQIFFEHDPLTQAADLKITEKGIKINQTYKFG